MNYMFIFFALVIPKRLLKINDIFQNAKRDPARDLKWNICHITNSTVYEYHNKTVKKNSFEKLKLWHHTINTTLALDKFLINLPPLMHIKARLGGWGARRRR